MRELLGDDVQAIRDVLREFVGETQRFIKSMYGAVGRGEMRYVAQEAHSLKGAAGNVGAVRLERLFRSLETASSCGDLQYSSRLMKSLEEALKALTVRLNFQGPTADRPKR